MSSLRSIGRGAGCSLEARGGPRRRPRSETWAFTWWRGRDSNPRPSGYEPDELPDCSTPRRTLQCSTLGGLEVVLVLGVDRLGIVESEGDVGVLQVVGVVDDHVGILRGGGGLRITEAGLPEVLLVRPWIGCFEHGDPLPGGVRAESLPMARCVVTRRLPGPALDRLAAVHEVEVWPGDLPPAADELRALAASAEGLLCLLTDRIDGALLEAAPRLRAIANYAVGTDNVDLAATGARGIPVGVTPDVLTDATADLTMALLLAVARRLPDAREAVLTG